ncbi:MAG: asparaginase [Blastococcus sp.]
MGGRPLTGAAGLPDVAVFSLGGTIASTGPSGSGVTPRLGAQELVDAVPQLRDVAQLEAVAFRQVPSGDLTLADLVALAAEIDGRLAAGCAGVVVTQGTDTVEETSFALDLLVRGPGAVVVTGALRSPTMAGADGPANLLAAVRVAVAPQAAGLGTVVVVGDEIHAARFVRKTHTSSPSAFRSGTAGALGWVVEGRVRIGLRVPSLPPVVPDLRRGTVPPVALLTCSLGDDARLLGQVGAVGYAGAVVQALGGGHVPAAVAPALEELARQIPVVLASRAGAGEVLTSTYGFAGSERDLLARGLVAAGFLDGPKARVLLSLLLAGGAGTDDVRAAFEQVNAPSASNL